MREPINRRVVASNGERSRGRALVLRGTQVRVRPNESKKKYSALTEIFVWMAGFFV